MRGQAALLWGTIAAEGWLELVPIRFVGFEEVSLSEDSNDRLVWQVAQTNQMFANWRYIILTANRNMKGIDSLEQVIREENTGTSLPVVTISNKERLDEQSYREQCSSRLVEILFDLENYMGVGRLYIPHDGSSTCQSVWNRAIQCQHSLPNFSSRIGSSIGLTLEVTPDGTSTTQNSAIRGVSATT
jgi:hypothetical protein